MSSLTCLKTRNYCANSSFLISGGMLPVTKECLLCKKTFTPHNYHHNFCSRRCFRRDYARRKAVSGYPVYICFYCRFSIKLTFNPHKEIKKLDDLICPHCGKPRHECLNKREDLKTHSSLC